MHPPQVAIRVLPGVLFRIDVIFPGANNRFYQTKSSGPFCFQDEITDAILSK